MNINRNEVAPDSGGCFLGRIHVVMEAGAAGQMEVERSAIGSRSAAVWASRVMFVPRRR